MEPCKPSIQTALLLTGNELLNGDIVDTNAPFIAQAFLKAGIRIERKLTIGDDLQTIVQALHSLSETHDVVVVNGGLGATVDDFTSEAVALVIDRPLEEHPAAVENIRKRYGRSFAEDNTDYYQHLKKQALLPQGVEIIPNPVGLAVGFKVKIRRALFYFTPGVPQEMRQMITESIIPDITEQFPLNPALVTRRLRIIGTGESRIQQMLHLHIPKDTWESIELGFQASMAMVELKLSIRDQSAAPLLASTEELVRSVFRDQIASSGETLEEAVVELLLDKAKSLCLAEGCSSGQITRMLHGAESADQLLLTSLVFNQRQSIDRYLAEYAESDEDELQRIPLDALNRLLLKKLLKQTGAGMGLVTSPAEPIVSANTSFPSKRLVVSCGSPDNQISREYVIARERDDFRTFVSIAALDLLRRYLRDYPIDNPYYFDEKTRHLLR